MRVRGRVLVTAAAVASGPLLLGASAGDAPPAPGTTELRVPLAVQAPEPPCRGTPSDAP